MVQEINRSLESTFRGLSFEEDSHTYTYLGNKMDGSVSTLVKKFVHKVDFDAIALRKAKGDKKLAKQYTDGWKKMGDDACARGHRAHYYGERTNHSDLFSHESQATTGLEEAIDKFWRELPRRYVVVAKELKMVHTRYQYCGTCDILLYDTITKKLVIVDYKTNKDLFKNYRGQTLMKPFSMLLDSPYNHYQLQLSFYQLLIEQTGYEVAERWLIWVKDDGSYDKMECYNFTDTLESWLKEKELTLAYT